NFNSIVDELSRSIETSADVVSVADITVCVAVRATDLNPWVLDRLGFMLSFYTPSPRFLVIDFGSEEPFSTEIEGICQTADSKVDYIYLDDKDTFSASIARNHCLEFVKTDLMFFTDVDVVHHQRFFGDLANIATDLELLTAIRRTLFMPVYHVGKEASEEFQTLSNSQKNIFLKTVNYVGQTTAFNNVCDFIAPYSNVYLIHKNFFKISGGYCSDFRGHGSEDFEFLVRLGILSSSIPLPEQLNKDFFGPMKDSFWKEQDYTGFRRYLEALTKMSESLGLACFHVWHDKPRGKGYWTDQNDWKRDTFNDVLGRYYPHLENIIEVDYLPREKQALCLFNDVNSWGYFLPLRLYGYQLSAVTSITDDNLQNIYANLERQLYDEVFIFNPYMKSHQKYRGILEVARNLGIKITVIERGGLPNSIYYADEVVYGDSTYKKLDKILSNYQCHNATVTESIIKRLKKGDDVLESQDSYEETRRRNLLLSFAKSDIFFIPLQLSDDMAVTKFVDGYTEYRDFYEEIKEVVIANPDKIFVIKQHPLSKLKVNNDQLDNLIIATERDNIHALIDLASAIIVYNSGVGLLSCLHQKPTFNIGNAYYTSQNLSKQVNSIQEAVDIYEKKEYQKISTDILVKYIDWLVFERYSWFSAESSIREFAERKAHGYKNIVVEMCNFQQQGLINTGSRISQFQFSSKSYLGWKVGLNYAKKNIKKAEKVPSVPVIKKVYQDSPNAKIIKSFFLLFLNKKKYKKLQESPERFFKDSKSKFVKKLEPIYLKSIQVEV
ncbi:MAG TPA: hypothetical protein H9889_03625, partial [Candidatus Ignatzschineria merdigallinarum]|nr:hypothetical protein [Candidatus Ignatzschineria merdigallinarum]